MSVARHSTACPPTRSDNRVRFLHEGDAYLDAMLEAIVAAEYEVLLEMYWFDSDAVGRRFAEALAARARAGVHVCVSYDAAGSWETDLGMFTELRAAGCQVRAFHPVRPWMQRFRLSRLNRRNHRKLLLVDGRVGMTGGANLALPWASVARGGGGWRDDVVVVEGAAVADMRDIFVAAFEALGGSCPPAPSPPVERPGQGCVQVLANGSRRRRLAIENAYLRAIRGARARVWIVNSYFIPRFAVRRALAAAARRGVDVRVLIPGRSDVPAALYATRYLVGWLLRHGVGVFEWHDGILHAKTAVIDDDWCTVGTHNLDYRSWLYNLEVNVVISDTPSVQALQGRLASDFAQSVPVNRERWRYRSVFDRLLEAFFYRFRRLL